MKKIYIILTSSPTYLARIIRTYTKDTYSHSSIALDKELNEMYSFGRLNAYNPFWGGFTRESIDFGTYKRFKNCDVAIYSLTVPDSKYQKAYHFNIPGLFAVALKKKIKIHNAFYCAEFVKYVLESSEITKDLPELIRPENFRNIEGINLEYTGTLVDYMNIYRTNLN